MSVWLEQAGKSPPTKIAGTRRLMPARSCRKIRTTLIEFEDSNTSFSSPLEDDAGLLVDRKIDPGDARYTRVELFSEDSR